MENWRKYMKETVMYHSTSPENAETISSQGLKVGMKSAHTTAGEWADRFYGTRPVYMSVEKGKYEGQPMAVNISGLDLVADLPGLVDTGAYQGEEGMYWEEGEQPPIMDDYVDEDFMIYYEDLLTPDHPVAEAAIKLTGTAATLEDISAEKIKLS